MTAPAPIDSTLFTWPADEPRLRGSLCRACAWRTFPVRSSCPRCASEELQEQVLPRVGRVWSFTTQEFQLKEPYVGPDAPFVLGYVDLDGLKVEARLDVPVADARTAVAIGTEVELVVVPLTESGLTYAFRPLEQHS